MQVCTGAASLTLVQARADHTRDYGQDRSPKQSACGLSMAFEDEFDETGNNAKKTDCSRAERSDGVAMLTLVGFVYSREQIFGLLIG